VALLNRGSDGSLQDLLAHVRAARESQNPDDTER
jgi:hypothetical protein